MKRYLRNIVIFLIPAAMSCSLWTSSPMPDTTATMENPTASQSCTTTPVTITITPAITKTNKSSKTPTVTKTVGGNKTPPPAEGYFELTFDYDAQQNPNSIIDLDSMEIRDDSSSDLELDVSIGSDRYNLGIFLNGAKGKSMGKGNVSLSDCRDIKESITDVEIWDMYIGNNLCVRTNSDRTMLLKIASVIYPSGRVTTIGMNYVM